MPTAVVGEGHYGFILDDPLHGNSFGATGLGFTGVSTAGLISPIAIDCIGSGKQERPGGSHLHQLVSYGHEVAGFETRIHCEAEARAALDWDHTRSRPVTLTTAIVLAEKGSEATAAAVIVLTLVTRSARERVS